MHTMRNKLLRTAATLLCSLLVTGAIAAPLAPGQAVPPLVASDQHDRPWSVAPSTRILLFAADKAASDLVTEALGERDADVLDARQAIFIADIHAMPSMITRVFALPALRALPYAVGLGRDAALTADLPRRKGQVTLIMLDNGVIGSLRFLGTPEDILQALDPSSR